MVVVFISWAVVAEFVYAFQYAPLNTWDFLRSGCYDSVSDPKQRLRALVAQSKYSSGIQLVWQSFFEAADITMEISLIVLPFWIIYRAKLPPLEKLARLIPLLSLHSVSPTTCQILPPSARKIRKFTPPIHTARQASSLLAPSASGPFSKFVTTRTRCTGAGGCRCRRRFSCASTSPSSASYTSRSSCAASSLVS